MNQRNADSLSKIEKAKKRFSLGTSEETALPHLVSNSERQFRFLTYRAFE
jgi:hypothetical protein